jgi:hypothetical protein
LDVGRIHTISFPEAQIQIYENFGHTVGRKPWRYVENELRKEKKMKAK